MQPVTPVVNTVAAADTKHAYLLLEQKQFAAAAKEAKDLAGQHPNDPEAWKIAGFAELNLKQYAEAMKDLEKAVELQRQTKQEDPNTESALGQAYVLSEKYQEALPLLVAATTRNANQPDALMIYYRGIAEYKTGKTADAEKTFNPVVKLNPKDSLSLFYLAQIALAKNDLDGAIASLNRATVNDARMTGAWTLLTSSYLRRAATSADQAKADADYLNAVRSGEALIKLRTDAEAITLFGQALIGSKQYARAAAALDRATASQDATGVTFYLLGVAHSRAANFPKAIAALDSAAKKSPDDVNIYRELGYAYEVTKQYAKALAAYQKGADARSQRRGFQRVDRACEALCEVALARTWRRPLARSRPTLWCRISASCSVRARSWLELLACSDLTVRRKRSAARRICYISTAVGVVVLIAQLLLWWLLYQAPAWALAQ